MKFVPTTNLYLYLQYINVLYTYMSFKCERSTEFFFFLFFFYSRRQFNSFPCDHLKMPYYIDGINTHTCTHTHPQPKMQTNKQTITTEKPAAKTLFKLFRWSLWTHITVRKTFSLVILTELSVCVWIALSSFFCCWKKNCWALHSHENWYAVCNRMGTGCPQTSKYTCATRKRNERERE